MSKRPLDKTKKSNIKCEHCKHYGNTENRKMVYNKGYFIWEELPTCDLSGDAKHYWNRCKRFEWADKYCEEQES